MLGISVETGIGLAAFLGVALWETWLPRRRLLGDLARRWTGNLVVYICGVYTIGWLTGIALGPGWTERLPGLSGGYAAGFVMLVGALFLDFENYWLHRLLHAVPPLWRCHALHHSDRAVDATTNFRHHPFEFVAIGLVLPISALALGIPAVVIVVYGVVSGVVATVHHGNIRLPVRLERALAPVIVTPNIHHIHHSIERGEADSNFGQLFSFWDRLFGTYTAPLPDDRRRLEFGIAAFRAPAHERLPMMMLIPFLNGERGA